MMIKRGIYIGFLIFYSSIFANDIAILQSDHAYYDEQERKFTAKGNVTLSYHDTAIKTEELHIDVDTNYAWSHYPTTIQKDDNHFHASSFSIDLNSEEISLTQIDITITPPENKGNLYIKTQKIIDTPEFKSGELGKLTTCELDYPHSEHKLLDNLGRWFHRDTVHHFIYAKKYKYIPNKKLIMYDVWFYNQLFVIPIYKTNYNFGIPIFNPIPIPVYHYYLGERDLIWNFPVIGKKENSAWDWYVQNTINYKYKNNKESSIYIDFFNPTGMPLLSERNVLSTNDRYIGYGIHHHYDYRAMDGSIYFYNLNFKNQIIDPITTLSNEIVILKNTYTHSPYLSLKTDYNYTNIAERLNSTGSQDTRSGGILFNYDKLGDQYKIEANLNIDNDQLINNHSFLLSRNFNNYQRYSINYSESQFSQLKKKKTIFTC